MDFILQAILFLIPFILCITIHEFAHAYVANKLGDDTAKQMGRMTLNPIPHIDPLGTIILPVIGIYTGFIFGWGKPVPVNGLNFRRGISLRKGYMLTSVAGPVSNIILSIITMALAALFFHVFKIMSVFAILIGITQFNLILAIFNLIPIPPLDGASVLAGISRKFYELLAKMENYSFFLFFGLIAFLNFVPNGSKIISFPIIQIMRFYALIFQTPLF